MFAADTFHNVEHVAHPEWDTSSDEDGATKRVVIRVSRGRADRLALRAPEREDFLDALAQRVRVAAREAGELAKT